MSSEKDLPSALPDTSNLLRVPSGGLIGRGLSAVRKSLAVPESGDAELLFRLGKRFRNPETGKADDNKARYYFLAAAKLNHAAAQFELAFVIGEYEGWAEATTWLESSAALGFGPALRSIAENLDNDIISVNLSKQYDKADLYTRATSWYQKHAEAGDADAQYGFARMLFGLEWSLQTRKNRALAQRWLRAAAEQGHRHACYDLGNSLLGEAHTDEGVYWLSRAAETGYSWACRALGDLYRLGHAGGRLAREPHIKLVNPDQHLAIYWYERQIELDRRRGSLMSLGGLARLYLLGDNVDQNVSLAERMLLEAANGGDLDSQRCLALEYASGQRFRRDTSLALKWHHLAFQNPLSCKSTDQYELGRFYEKFADDAPNYAEAVKWYRASAEQGDLQAAERLADLYELENSLIQDRALAYIWRLLSYAFFYAVGREDRGCESSLKSLALKMKADELAQARQFARNWLTQAKSIDRRRQELALEGLDHAP